MKIIRNSITTEQRSKMIGIHPNSEFRQNQINEVVEKRATRQQLAMDTHYEEFILYRRSHVGQDKCPCWLDTNNEPAGNCKLCFGFGYLPPYVPAGYQTDTILHTDARITGLNMFPNYEPLYMPPAWNVKATALNGRLESDWLPVMPNHGEGITLWTDNDDMSKMEIYFITNRLSQWLPISDIDENLPLASKYKIRVDFKKNFLDDVVPDFQGMHLRYKVSGSKPFKCTMPQWALSEDRSGDGLLRLIESSQFIATGKIDNLGVGDFFQHVKTGLRFRVSTINNKVWNGVVMEWDTQVRKVQPNEQLIKVI